MRPHKFKVGELVAFNPAVSRFVPGGVYEVIKHLPGNGEYEYRIKSANEPHERVAREPSRSGRWSSRFCGPGSSIPPTRASKCAKLSGSKISSKEGTR
jgi:hypothetical protein